MATHTDAPWRLCFDGQIDGADGHTVCRFPWSTFKEFNDSPENKANARLIAAAPDLLAALQALVEHGTDSPIHLAAEAAIRKATTQPS